MAQGGLPGAVVQRIDVEPIHAVVMRALVTFDHLPGFIARASRLVGERAIQHGCVLRGRPLARFLRRDEVLVVEVGYQVATPWPGCCVDDEEDGLHLVSFGGHPVVSVLHVGELRTVETAYAVALEWMREHHLFPVGAPWEVYLDGPESVPWRTAIHLPFESITLLRQRGWTTSDGPADE